MRLNSVFKVTLLYLVFGLLWIYFSDQILSVIFKEDFWQLSRLQTAKGFFYVSLTSLLLYHLVKKYNGELHKKIVKIERSKEELIKSEENYRLLFDSSPTPIFIYQPDTEMILSVNNAALNHYGYTPSEFSSMKIAEIEDENDLDLKTIEEKLHIPTHEDMLHSNGIHRHKKKNGDQVYVYMQGSAIIYEGRKAHIVMINDITYQLNYIHSVEEHNRKLNEISWMQSHVVRAPLASLMGLIHVLEDTKIDSDERQKILPQVVEVARELDGIIKEISNNASLAKA